MKKELIENPTNRRVKRESIKWGFMKGKYRREFEALIHEFKEDQSNKALKVDDMLEVLERIKSILEESKAQYTDVFILPRLFYNYNYDDDEAFFNIEIGRYETDEEVKDRLNRNKEKKNKLDAEKLKREAKQYLELKQKFKDSKELSLS